MTHCLYEVVDKESGEKKIGVGPNDHTIWEDPKARVIVVGPKAQMEALKIRVVEQFSHVSID